MMKRWSVVFIGFVAPDVGQDQANQNPHSNEQVVEEVEDTEDRPVANLPINESEDVHQHNDHQNNIGNDCVEGTIIKWWEDGKNGWIKKLLLATPNQ